MERIGVAITRPYGDRRMEYGIYVILEAYGVQIDNPTLYLKYEGYRRGSVSVGLPLAGPHAAHLQPLIEFYPHSRDWESIRFFREGPWSQR